MPSKRNSDEIRDLILKVRENDDNAFKLMLQKYTPLIESSVNRFSGDDSFAAYSDDLRQEASVVFYKSILAFDLDQNEVEFGLFAKICIYNALVSQLRGLKKHPGAFSLALPEKEEVIQDTGDPASTILEQERIKAIYDIIRKNLSDYEYSVWQMYIAGRSSLDIAKTLSADKRSIDNAIYRIRKKLRELLK